MINVEPEQAILGTILLNNDCYALVKLTAEDFADPVHQRIWARIATRISLSAIQDYAASLAILTEKRKVAALLSEQLEALNDPDKDAATVLGAVEAYGLARGDVVGQRSSRSRGRSHRAPRGLRGARRQRYSRRSALGIDPLDHMTGGLFPCATDDDQHRHVVESTQSIMNLPLRIQARFSSRPTWRSVERGGHRGGKARSFAPQGEPRRCPRPGDMAQSKRLEGSIDAPGGEDSRFGCLSRKYAREEAVIFREVM